MVIHRQGGKTHAILWHLIKAALKTPSTSYAYIAPYRNQAKIIVWERLKEIVRPIPFVESNESDLTLKFPNNSIIRLFGADNPDSLRGNTFHGVVFDEYSQQPGNIFEEIIYPTLSTTNGFAIWIGTPKGKNQLYDLFTKAQANPEEYLSIFKTIEDTIAEEDGETVQNLRKSLEDAKRLVSSGLMTEDAFLQELYCSFDASVKGAYYADPIAKTRAEGRIRPVPYDPDLLVYTVWDLGVGDDTAIGFYQKSGETLRMIDYYEDSGKAFPFYKSVLDQKNYAYGSHYAPHDSKHREFQTGQTLIQFARALGVNFQEIPNVPREDGIDSGRRVFNKMVFDAEKTGIFIDKLSRYHKKFDEKHGIFLDRPEHDDTSHAADVHRYMSLVEKDFSQSLEINNNFTMFHEYA